MKKVIIYSQTTCPPCYQAKAWLADQKIPFISYEVDKDPEALRRFQTWGMRTTPVFIVGDQVISGFNSHKLKRAWNAYNKENT